MASARAIPESVEFTVRGNTSYFGEWESKECKFAFENLSAEGAVNGDLKGSLTYLEEGKGNLCVPHGVNEGLMTVVTDDGTIDIGFKGKTDMINVWGHWKLEDGMDDYDGCKGGGFFYGDASLYQFTVTFTGFFCRNQD